MVILMVIFSLGVASVEPTQDLEINMIERWGMYELTLTGPETGNPFVDVELTAEFALNGRVFAPHGFYDGGGVYKIRFMPDCGCASFPRITCTTKTSRSTIRLRGTPLTDWDFTRFNPEFWRRFEQRVGDLLHLGIEADKD